MIFALRTFDTGQPAFAACAANASTLLSGTRPTSDRPAPTMAAWPRIVRRRTAGQVVLPEAFKPIKIAVS